MSLRCNSKTLAQRFAEGKAGKSHNASVSVVALADHDEVNYRLHNTMILRGKHYRDGRKTSLTLLNWGGWFTSTTQKHMNNVLNELGLPTVSRTNWTHSPRVLSTQGSEYVVHYAASHPASRSYVVTGMITSQVSHGFAHQPLYGPLFWLHTQKYVAVQRASEYDFSQGMTGETPKVVAELLGNKRRRFTYNGPCARVTGVTK